MEAANQAKASVTPATPVARKHELIKDKVIIRVAIAVFVFLCLSWSAQWASYHFAVRNLKHTGVVTNSMSAAFFKSVDSDFSYNNTTFQISADKPHEWRCEKFEDYVDNFMALFPDHTSDWYVQAGSAKKLIVVSRWFECLTTSFDMVFGTTTIWAVVYPHVDRKIQKTNMMIALIGVLLTPSFCLIDSFVQNSYWASIGVGIYEKDVQKFLYASRDISWISTFIDFCLQIGFLIWGTRKQYLLAQGGDEIAMRGVV